MNRQRTFSPFQRESSSSLFKDRESIKRKKWMDQSRSQNYNLNYLVRE